MARKRQQPAASASPVLDHMAPSRHYEVTPPGSRHWRPGLREALERAAAEWRAARKEE